MITDKTLDEAMVEAARFLKAAKALRAARKIDCIALAYLHEPLDSTRPMREHAACTRASLDLTRKLADLRAGR